MVGISYWQLLPVHPLVFALGQSEVGKIAVPRSFPGIHAPERAVIADSFKTGVRVLIFYVKHKPPSAGILASWEANILYPLLALDDYYRI